MNTSTLMCEKQTTNSGAPCTSEYTYETEGIRAASFIFCTWGNGTMSCVIPKYSKTQQRRGNKKSSKWSSYPFVGYSTHAPAGSICRRAPSKPIPSILASHMNAQIASSMSLGLTSLLYENSGTKQRSPVEAEISSQCFPTRNSDTSFDVMYIDRIGKTKWLLYRTKTLQGKPHLRYGLKNPKGGELAYTLQ